MNDLTKYQESQLPDTIEDLSKFVLVNEERVQALRAQIRAIKKVSLAKDVYEQKLAEAQEIGEVTVMAAQKMGELLLQIEKHQGRPDRVNSANSTEELKTKTEITEEIGMTRHQVNDYQQMAQNPEAVKAAIQNAIDRGDVVSRSQVMKEIRKLKDEIVAVKDENKMLRDREPKVVTKEVEVEPSDYRLLLKEHRELAQENSNLKREVNNLKHLPEQAKEQQKLETDAEVFAIRIRDFLQSVSGYAWVTDRMENIPENQRKTLLTAITNLDGWCRATIRNLGGGIVNG